MPHLDIFNDDAFSLASLTKAMSDQLYVPSKLGSMKLFSEEGVTTTQVTIERIGDSIALVPATERGAPGRPVGGDKRNMLSLNTIHLPQSATILADEVQNVRAFGGETELEAVQTVVNKRLRKLRRNLDVTIEHQRIGAMKGIVMDSDGTTPLLNMFDAFGVVQQTHEMNLDVDATKVRYEVIAAVRKMEDALGGFTYTQARVLCSSTFFDDFVKHPAVEAAFDRWQNGEFLRNDPRGGFSFGGVVWEEYRGGVGALKFVPDGEAYLYPEGVSDLFVTWFAPAPYMETANTNGLPYYAKQEILRFNKGVEIESQSNPLSICTRPRVVVKLNA